MEIVKKNLRKIFLRAGYIVKKHPSKNTHQQNQRALEFIATVRDMLVATDMVRIGGSNDGGYLVPKNLKGVNYCFSPGVEETSNFELQLANKYAIRCFMADASVEKPVTNNKYFSFDKKFLGDVTSGNTITLSDWIKDKENEIANDCNMILQMDIEGAEIDVLLETPVEVLSRFCIMVIEFHHMQSLFTEIPNRTLKFIFGKLQKHFCISHIHPNNASIFIDDWDASVPPLLEITFVRKDWVKKNNIKISFPHPLDEKNLPDCEDVVLPEIWWKN